MQKDAHLETIRRNLFYGLLEYTKSFPDFLMPQRFSTASPREGAALLENIRASLEEEQNILLYVHFPFCFSACVFCNAFPHKTSHGVQKEYTKGLLKEIDIYSRSALFDGKTVKCIYLGGGTPTTFTNQDIGDILDKIASCAGLSEDCNITCEAHPADLIKNERVKELVKLGIKRVSMGCQTFDPKVLELCKRSNPETQVREAVRKARESGLWTNIDMMIGLPGQTVEGVRRDLDVLSDMAPDSIEYMRHEIVNPSAISLYQTNEDLLVKTDDLFWMAYHTQEWMEEKGYQQNGRFTGERVFPYRYHWLREMPFLALGSRSRSYTKTVCYDKHEDLSLYLRLIEKDMSPIARYTVLNKREQMFRSLFLNIQVKAGLDLAAFQNRFGEAAPEVFAPLLRRLSKYGCVAIDRSSIRLSKYGRYFVEDVCCLIVDHALEEVGYQTPLKRLPHSSGSVFDSLAARSQVQQRGQGG